MNPNDLQARDKLLGVPSHAQPGRRHRAPWARHVLMVTSGKGGVGKTTVAVNLASAFAQRDWKVGLLDADVYGPSVPRMLQLGDERLRWNEAGKIEPSENFGLKVMSVGMTTPEADTPLIWRSSVATSAIIQLIDDVDWGELDLLVVDMPPGTGDTQLSVAQELKVSGAVVVTTPQPVATDDVRRAIRMLQEVSVPIAGIVENMSGFVAPDTGRRYALFGEGGGAALAADYGLPLLAQLPFDPQLSTACDAGTPLAAVGTAEQRRPFDALAAALCGVGGVLAPRPAG